MEILISFLFLFGLLSIFFGVLSFIDYLIHKRDNPND